MSRSWIDYGFSSLLAMAIGSDLGARGEVSRGEVAIERRDRHPDLQPDSPVPELFHTGAAESEDDRVAVLGPNEFAPLVLNAGLLDWLIERTS